MMLVKMKFVDFDILKYSEFEEEEHRYKDKSDFIKYIRPKKK